MKYGVKLISTMQRAHKIRIYPTKEQEVQLYKTAGTSRYVYNWALDQWKSQYEKFEKGEAEERPNTHMMCRRWTLQKPEWAKETNNGSQRAAIMDLGTAFQNFWKGHASYPKFHKKGRKDSFYVANDKAYISDSRISLPKIGKVRLAEPLRYTGKIMSYVVSTYAGQWFVSVQVETNADAHPRCEAPQSSVGIDVGLSHVAVASDGTTLDMPKSLHRLDKHLKALRRKLSKKAKHSRNRSKALRRKQKVQRRINDIRKDAVHKFTSTITKNHGIVVTEDLNLKGMVEKGSKSLRRSLAHSLMGEVIRQVSYKAQRHVMMDRFFPSSKKCSCCGFVKASLGLDERTYRCEACGLVIDRDFNASLNLMQAEKVIPGVPVESASSC